MGQPGQAKALIVDAQPAVRDDDPVGDSDWTWMIADGRASLRPDATAITLEHGAANRAVSI